MSNLNIRGTNWSTLENIATIDRYLSLFRDDLAGKKINKTAAYSELSDRFGRSPKAYGRKMSNISAILRDLGWPTMDGLKPAEHYQKSLQKLLAERLGNYSLDEIICETLQRRLPEVANQIDLVHRPSPELGKSKIVASTDVPVILAKRDYLEIESANRELGLCGESLVVRHEKRMLRSLGKSLLSERVEHVAQTRGDGLGYDVISFEPSGKEKFIEVKTTNYSRYTPFFLTPGEVRVSEEMDAHYHLYRLYNLRNTTRYENNEVEFYTLQGSLEKSVKIVPISYLAYPNKSRHN